MRLINNIIYRLIMTTGNPVNPSEVGWQFVPQYYTFVNKQPNRLHCFYTKASTFIHGTEGEDGKPCYGQQVRFIHLIIAAVHASAVICVSSLWHSCQKGKYDM